MALKVGIVGLPNVGKSSLFNVLTSAKAIASNFPFTTIEPNIGIAAVPDERLDQLSALFKPVKTTPTTTQFVDIAGLIKGAAAGEGLGNAFLSHIREVDLIVEVVREFEDDNIIHVAGQVDPSADIETIETELALADLATITTRIGATQSQLKNNPKLQPLLTLLEKIKSSLDQGQPASGIEVTKELEPEFRSLNLLTAKPIIYVLNVSEDQLLEPSTKANSLKLSVKLEEELGSFSAEERLAYLANIGVETDALLELIRLAYARLGLITFFTAGEDEVKAWPIRQGFTAPEAAGTIHTDFTRGFIAAEITNWRDLVTAGSFEAARTKGLVKTEGKTYVMKDGDTALFRFNV